jgi:hypothetical protein
MPTISRFWFLAGLLLTSQAILALEMIDTRLLSVLTWYDLSFFAVSTAMFGLSVGAVRVQLGGAQFEGSAAYLQLRRCSRWFALSLVLCHLANLALPLALTDTLTDKFTWFCSLIALGVPFYLGGILVTIALTRIDAPVGQIYATDLLGAALGTLLFVWLIVAMGLPSAAFVVGATAVLGSACFHPPRQAVLLVLIAALLVTLGCYNVTQPKGFRVLYSKGTILLPDDVLFEEWNVHSMVMAFKPKLMPILYWTAGKGAGGVLPQVWMFIDGSAGTSMTAWDGKRESLDWCRYDLPSLIYHLRKGGNAAIIGVGGGRDVLAALWGQSQTVTGIELNKIFVDFLIGPLRTFANLYPRRDVRLYNDEARSYFTRSKDKFDTLQMSMIDTWAATGAGAFTMSENGLYTKEAWKMFLEHLKPGGMFSVSRWFSPDRVSETTRMIALGTDVLLDRGAAHPSAHIALVSRGQLATMLLSTLPLTPTDLRTLQSECALYDFKILLAPGRPPADTFLGAVVASKNPQELRRTLAQQPFNYTPPTDDQPYFFNLLTPRSFLHLDQIQSKGVVDGNIRATTTLVLLFCFALVLTVALILVPLWRTGKPDLPGRGFSDGLLYFATIGLGFMFVQIPLMQRFSVYLGHPSYSVPVILFSMILFAGLGSALSDQLPLAAARWAPLVGAAVLLLLSLAVKPICGATLALGLLPRCGVVVLVVAPVALVLGFFFPLGMRLMRQVPGDVTAWMWGANGACGVLASIVAVMISIWAGINSNFMLACLLYLGLLGPSRRLYALGSQSRAK